MPRALANVTVSLPEHLLREARHLAVDEGISLSRFVALSLAQRVEAVRGYHVARDRQLRLLAEGLELGTPSPATRPRDSLHER